MNLKKLAIFGLGQSLSLICLTFALVLVIGCQQQTVDLKRGSISVVSCMFPFKTNCFNGSGQLPGCSESCAYTIIDSGLFSIRMVFEYEASGSVVDAKTAIPIEGMEVQLMLPNRKRYVTQTRSDGSFTISVKSDIQDQDSKFEQNFGTMKTIPEAGKITLVSDLTKAFRDAHPDLKYQLVEVVQFDGETIKR